MKVRYEDDADKGAGNGIFVCTEDNFDGSEDWEFSLQTISPQKFLTPSGEWLAQPAFMWPEDAVFRDGELRIYVGSNVVDSLDTQERYRMQVRRSETVLEGRLAVRSVLCSAPELTGNTVKVEFKGAEQDRKATRLAPAAVSDPVLEPQPVPAPQPQPAVEPEPAPVPDNDTDSLSMNGNGEQSKKKSALPLVIAGVVLVVAIAGAAWYFLGAKKPVPQPTPAPNQTEQQVPPSDLPAQLPGPAPDQNGQSAPNPDQSYQQPEAPKPAEPTPAPANTPPPAQQQAPTEQQVHIFFQSLERNPAEAARMARELPKNTPVEQDAVYRLFYFAGENGENSVLMDYAATLDPSKPQWGTINKDAAEAWRLYEKAKAADPQGAQAAQSAMQNWLKERAASGDARADVWLKQLR